MSGYMLAMIDVSDMDQYREYIKHSSAAVAKHGGIFLTRGGETKLLEGSAMPASRMVLLKFPSYAETVAFYDSPEYVIARGVRDGAATATFVALEGYEPPTES